jgi:hypothetical protein
MFLENGARSARKDDNLFAICVKNRSLLLDIRQQRPSSYGAKWGPITTYVFHLKTNLTVYLNYY